RHVRLRARPAARLVAPRADPLAAGGRNALASFRAMQNLRELSDLLALLALLARDRLTNFLLPEGIRNVLQPRFAHGCVTRPAPTRSAWKNRARSRSTCPWASRLRFR